MPFPAAHNYVTVHWTVPGSVEGGQFGLRFISATPATQADADNIASSVRTTWVLPATNIQPNYNLAFIKVARILPSGLYDPAVPPLTGAVTQPAIAGGTSGIQFPLQSACVVTLRTAVASGLAHSGRIYLPPLAGLLSGNQLWTASMVNNFNTQMATLLSALSGSGVGVLAIMSQGNPTFPAGAVHAVTGCQTDYRPDVQRRRAAQIISTPGPLVAIS